MINTHITPLEVAATVKKTFQILYADDMSELRRLLDEMLSRYGHTVETAADGQEALNRINGAGESFDVVITDHHMPVMNGLELVRKLRGQNFPGKILVFTSELSSEVRDAYHQLGVEYLLPKPIFPSTLQAILSSL